MGFVFGPSWFYGINSGFSLFAMLVTVFIAFYSLRVFLITKYRKYLYFTLAFLFISISYLIQAAGNYVVYSHLIGRIPNVTEAISTIVQLPTFYSMGYIIHVFLMFAGFMILVAIFLRINNIKILSLLFALILILSFLSQSKFAAFHITLFVMLLFIVIHLFNNYSKKKTVSSFLVLYSIICLMISQVFLFLVIINKFYYVIGHILQLVGFTLLLLNMVLVFRK